MYINSFFYAPLWQSNGHDNPKKQHYKKDLRLSGRGEVDNTPVIGVSLVGTLPHLPINSFHDKKNLSFFSKINYITNIIFSRWCTSGHRSGLGHCHISHHLFSSPLLWKAENAKCTKLVPNCNYTNCMFICHVKDKTKDVHGPSGTAFDNFRMAMVANIRAGKSRLTPVMLYPHL